jgi:hypothetical protein
MPATSCCCTHRRHVFDLHDSRLTPSLFAMTFTSMLSANTLQSLYPKLPAAAAEGMMEATCSRHPVLLTTNPQSDALCARLHTTHLFVEVGPQSAVCGPHQLPECRAAEHQVLIGAAERVLSHVRLTQQHPAAACGVRERHAARGLCVDADTSAAQLLSRRGVWHSSSNPATQNQQLIVCVRPSR